MPRPLDLGSMMTLAMRRSSVLTRCAFLDLFFVV